MQHESASVAKMLGTESAPLTGGKETTDDNTMLPTTYNLPDVKVINIYKLSTNAEP